MKFPPEAMERIARFLENTHKAVYEEPESDLHKELTAFAVEKVKPKLEKGSWVLDVGVGRGYAFRLFSEPGKHVAGVTLNESETHLDPRIALADQNSLFDGWTEFFGCVFARHVLEHSPIPLFTLIEFKRVLKEKGWLYVEVPAPDTACNHEANPNHYSVLGIRAWSCLIDRAGFEIVEAWTRAIHTQAGPDQYFSFLCRKK